MVLVETTMSLRQNSSPFSLFQGNLVQAGSVAHFFNNNILIFSIISYCYSYCRYLLALVNPSCLYKPVGIFNVAHNFNFPSNATSDEITQDRSNLFKHNSLNNVKSLKWMTRLLGRIWCVTCRASRHFIFINTLLLNTPPLPSLHLFHAICSHPGFC